jgi:protoporphyrinogen oxidase
MKVAVIGAGPAGLSSAYQLVKADIETHVFEASNFVGGLARTINLWNQRVDLGPHRFFSKDKRVNDLWLEIVGTDYVIVDRLTRILYKNKFYNYPLKPVNVLSNLGLTEAAMCILSYLQSAVVPVNSKISEETFESWVVKRFGRRMFEIFFKTYSEKLWGIPCNELDADFAFQRINKLSLFEAIKNALLKGEKNKHKTLAEKFAYPVEGTGMVYERMASYVSKNGGKVFLNCPVNRVLTEDKEMIALELTNGTVHKYDHIISSMPLTLLVARLSDVPEDVRRNSSSLGFRNTILVYLNVQSENLFPDNWVYIHSSNFKTGRITNFKNWAPDLNREATTSILALEYWCYDTDDIWAWNDTDLIEIAKNELRQTGLIGDTDIADGYVYRISKCYPVYRRGYKQSLRPIEDYLKEIKGLTVIGRYGAFKYNNQDHSILMGILAAENITKGKNHDLWQVNSNYQYQESALISETGLKKQEA